MIQFLKLYLLTCLMLLSPAYGGQTINDLTVHKFVVESTADASKPCPLMTTAQRDALGAPVNGNCLFNTDTLKLNIYNGSVWRAAGGGVDNWATTTAYTAGDVVIQSYKLYYCETTHTSGTFATDLAALKWTETSATPIISLTTGVSGILPVANGGTGSGTRNFVDLTSSETIAGVKTFSSTIVGSINGNAATVTTNANLTGAVTSSGNATSLGSFASADLAGALTNETGSGASVFATSPTLVTPNLGTPASGTMTNVTGLPLTTAVTGILPVANGGTGSGTRNFVDLTSSESIDGTKTFLDPAVIDGLSITGITSGNFNTGLGGNVLQSAVTAVNNTAIGSAAGTLIDTGDDNSLMGYTAGASLTTGSRNNYIGSESGGFNDVGNDNVAMGYQTLIGSFGGERNTAVGNGAGASGPVNDNVMLGYKAGFNASGSDELWIANTDSGTGSNLLTGRFDTGQLGVNVNPGSIGASALLQLDSTSMGFLAPRMTTAERNAISSPAEGLMVFDTDLNTIYIFDGSTWGTAGGAGNLTGAVTSVGLATSLGSFTSANLSGALTNETGSGVAVFATSPTLTTPTIGVATATTVNKVAITAPATGSTLTIADGKTLTASNSITLAGTDGKGIDVGAATSRKILVGDGTNMVLSTETYAVPGTSGNVLTSDGTNWTSAAAGTGTAQVTTGGGVSPKLFSVAFGTTNTNTICSASPCFIRAIGSEVTSVTRLSLGTYRLNMSATFSLVNCSVSLADGSGSMSMYSGTNISCASCNTVTFDWANTSVLKDARGVIMCHAIP